jgi:hypothetical protein
MHRIQEPTGGLRGLARGAAAVIAGLVLAAAPARGASHREAPAMTLDPGADISDVYAFVSYDDTNVAAPLGARKVTLIMNVVPGQEPSSGPNYFGFDDEVLYAIHVDNDRDGIAADVAYEITFDTAVENPTQFLATLALPPVTHLEGPNAAGLARKQRYKVVELRGCGEPKAKRRKCKTRTPLFGGESRPSVPSNVGPLTMPDYDSLAAQGIFTDAATGIRVFAGQRAETFAIDLGAVFDTVNLRVENAAPIADARPPLPVQTAAEDAGDSTNPFGVNSFSGFNVNTIAIEVPVTRLTRDGAAPTSETGTIGVYALTFRHQQTIRQGDPTLNERKPPKQLVKARGPFRQVSRMGNPLVNELIIPVGLKDLWNATVADDEAQFLVYYRQLAVAGALELVSGVPVTPNPREDVVQLLTKYADQDPAPTIGPFSDLLRLDMTVAPTPAGQIKRLGPFAHDAAGNPTPDPAGFPNGRRPNDDVTDLVVRVAGGPNYISNFVGDGVGVSEKGITLEFPFLPTPFDGRDRRHRDPGEN